MDDLNQIRLSGPNGFNRFIRCWRLINYVGVFPALHASRHAHVVLDREATLGFSRRHGATRPVAAAHEAIHVALAADDVGTSSQTSRNDTHIAFAGSDCAFACNESVLAVVPFAGHIIVVAVDGRQLS